MTELKKTVTRMTSVCIFERGTRPIVASLEAPGLLALRLKGCKRTFRLPLTTCYMLAVRAEVEAKKREKAAARKAKKRR